MTYLEKLQEKKAQYEQDVKDYAELLEAAEAKLAVIEDLIDDELEEQEDDEQEAVTTNLDEPTLL